jgi:hypothetical protein
MGGNNSKSETEITAPHPEALQLSYQNGPTPLPAHYELINSQEKKKERKKEIVV